MQAPGNGNTSRPVNLTAESAAKLLRAELAAASEALRAGTPDATLDASVRALGLALQLGPAATEMALRSILDGVQQWLAAFEPQLKAAPDNYLASLGPALVDLVQRVWDAGALPGTEVMAAWATVAHDLAALLGQWGLALSLSAESREGMMGLVRARAAQLDEATGSLFSLAALIGAGRP